MFHHVTFHLDKFHHDLFHWAMLCFWNSMVPWHGSLYRAKFLLLKKAPPHVLLWKVKLLLQGSTYDLLPRRIIWTTLRSSRRNPTLNPSSLMAVRCPLRRRRRLRVGFPTAEIYTPLTCSPSHALFWVTSPKYAQNENAGARRPRRDPSIFPWAPPCFLKKSPNTNSFPGDFLKHRLGQQCGCGSRSGRRSYTFPWLTFPPLFNMNSKKREKSKSVQQLVKVI